MAPARSKPAARKPKGVFHVEFDGTTYAIDVGSITFADQVRIRVESGMSRLEFAQALEAGIDPELIAGLVWITAKRDGRPDLTYREVLNALTFENLVEEGDAVPPASAGASPSERPTTRTSSGSARGRSKS